MSREMTLPSSYVDDLLDDIGVPDFLTDLETGAWEIGANQEELSAGALTFGALSSSANRSLPLRTLPNARRPHTRSEARICDKGHTHGPWPLEGAVTIEKCERSCNYCTLRIKDCASNLRKHVQKIHITRDGLNIKIVQSTSGRMTAKPKPQCGFVSITQFRKLHADAMSLKREIYETSIAVEQERQRSLEQRDLINSLRRRFCYEETDLRIMMLDFVREALDRGEFQVWKITQQQLFRQLDFSIFYVRQLDSPVTCMGFFIHHSSSLTMYSLEDEEQGRFADGSARPQLVKMQRREVIGLTQGESVQLHYWWYDDHKYWRYFSLLHELRAPMSTMTEYLEYS